MTELSRVPVTALKGVGAALAEKLARVGLETLQDILFHLPCATRTVPASPPSAPCGQGPTRWSRAWWPAPTW